MRNVYELYLSYLKLALISMVCAFVVYSLGTGLLLGSTRMIVGTLGAGIMVGVFVIATLKSSSVRIVWHALNESWKHPPKAAGPEAQSARTINTKALRILLPLRQRILSWSTSERMYVISGAVLCLFVPWFFLSLFLQPVEQLGGPTASVMIGLGFLAAGAMIEIYKVVLLIWNNTVGKFVLGLLAALIANTTYVFARAEVNGITGMDPSKFTTAVATLSVILTPLIWLESIVILLALIFLAGYMVAVIYHYLKTPMFDQVILGVRNSVPYRFLLDKRMYRGKKRYAGFDIARLFGLMSLIFFLIFPTFYLKGSIRHMRGFFTRVFIQTETYRSSRCLNHHAEERVAFLDGGKILVAKPDNAGGYTFELRTCE